MLDLAQWLAGGDWLRSANTEELRSQPASEFASFALDCSAARSRKPAATCRRSTMKRDTRCARRPRSCATRLSSSAAIRRQARSGRHKRFVALLEDLQDHLGALNDLATAPAMLQALGLEGNPEARVLLDETRKRELIASAVDAHEAFIDASRFWRAAGEADSGFILDRACPPLVHRSRVKKLAAGSQRPDMALPHATQREVQLLVRRTSLALPTALRDVSMRIGAGLTRQCAVFPTRSRLRVLPHRLGCTRPAHWRALPYSLKDGSNLAGMTLA